MQVRDMNCGIDTSGLEMIYLARVVAQSAVRQNGVGRLLKVQPF